MRLKQKKYRFKHRLLKSAVVLSLVATPIAQTLPALALTYGYQADYLKGDVNEYAETLLAETIDGKLRLTFAGQDTLQFEGYALYTVEFRDGTLGTSVDEEYHAVYTIHLPYGVELDARAFEMNAVAEWDEEMRIATLHAPASSLTPIAIPLRFDLEESIELYVVKATEVGVYESLPLTVEVLTTQEMDEVREERDLENEVREEAGEEPVFTPIQPRIELGAPVNAPSPGNALFRPTPDTAYVYNFADFIDAITNFQVYNIILRAHVVFPQGTVANQASAYNALRGRTGTTSASAQPNTGMSAAVSVANGWVSGSRFAWTTNNPGSTTLGSNTGGSLAMVNVGRNNAANPTNPNRPIVIDGQGRYAIDSGSMTMDWQNTGGQSRQVHVRNLTTFNGNYYGWFQFREMTPASAQQNSRIIYENIIHHGSQLAHTPSTPIEFRGYVAAIQPNPSAFDSPFRAGLWSHHYRSTGFQETNLHAQNVTITDHAQVYLSSTRTGNLNLAGFMTVGANALVYMSGSMMAHHVASIESGAGIADDSMGYNIHLSSNNAQVLLHQNARVFAHTDETMTGVGGRFGGALLFNGTGSRLHISEGASFEIFSTGAGRTTTTSTSGRTLGPTISLSNNAIIEVEDYGRLQIFETGRAAAAVPPIWSHGNSTIRIGRNGIFDVTSDTGRQLLWTQQSGLGSGSRMNVIFDDAYRVNLHRFNRLNQTQALLGHSADAGLAIITVENQRISQWDGGIESPVENVEVHTLSTTADRMHGEAFPAGRSMPHSVNWTVDDENASRYWTPVYSVNMTFQGGNGNAVNTNIRAFSTQDQTTIAHQLGRANTVHGATGHSTGGAKPNRLLFSKLYELDVQLFTNLTDNPDFDERDFNGSVTQGILRGGDGGYIANADGTHATFEPSTNPETRAFTFDPRREIVGRTGVVVYSVNYVPALRQMVRESRFIPLPNVMVRLEENGAINPVTNAHVADFSGVDPTRTQTIELPGLIQGELAGTTFADLNYSLRSSEEAGIVIPSSGNVVTGEGFFVYTLPDYAIAEDLVRVSAFENGREFIHGIQPRMQSLRVLDETTPLADSRFGAVDGETALELAHNSGGSLHTPSFFVENKRDTNPFSHYDGFYSFAFDFTTPHPELEGVTPITSVAHFQAVVSDLGVLPTDRFSIGVRVSDPAGNYTVVHTVFYISVDSRVVVEKTDLFIYESALVGSMISTNVDAMANWLIQQAIDSVLFEVSDSEGTIVSSQTYTPLATGDLDTEIFRIVNKNGLFNQQTAGVVYKIEAVLLAERANPSGLIENGIIHDQPITFSVKIINDRMSILDVANLDFGTQAISAVNRMDRFELNSGVQLLEISDPRGIFDTSAGTSTALNTVVAPSESEMILTGRITDINLITERAAEEIQSQWHVSASMTRAFEDNGHVLPAVIHFGEGTLQTGVVDHSLYLNTTLTYTGAPIQIAQGRSGQGEMTALRGRHRVVFSGDSISVQVPTGARTGNFTAEITYTMTAGPES